MLEQMWSLIMEQKLHSVLIQGMTLSQCNAQKVSGIKGQKILTTIFSNENINVMLQ